jgi:PTS system nitrogen regulatory IIA component
MRLSKAIRKECLCAKAHCTDKEQVLREAANLAKKSPELNNIPVERILQGFRDRESLCSTGVGDGIAIPHCRIPNVTDFVVGMITLETPVDFDSVDEKKVSIVAFIVGPESNVADHPRILSGLSMRLSSDGGMKKLLSASTSQELLDALELPKSQDIAEDAQAEKRIMHIVAQDEDIFLHVLEAIESIDGATAIVVESSNASEYLTRMPVFASFLADSPSRFCRMIMATVPKVFTNEAIRRVEAVTGHLDDRKDITVIVQDVFLMAGTLGV